MSELLTNVLACLGAAVDSAQAAAVLSNREKYGFNTGLIGWYEIVEVRRYPD